MPRRLDGSTWPPADRHLTACSGELFKMMTGINMVHVPIAAQRRVDRSARRPSRGDVRQPAQSSVGHIKGGKIRALGVTTVNRAEALPACRPSASSARL
jgi:tripartite-type tricarboxylate transporter receptor subunit TctC